MHNQAKLKQAVDFLHRQDFDALAVEEAAVLLLFFPDEMLMPERKKLEDVVRGSSSWQWIQESPLLEVFLRLSALYKWGFPVDKGTVAAKVLKRLLSAEKEPGGPYLESDKSLDIVANLVIAAYLTRQDIVLPKLLHFVTASMESGPSPTLLNSYELVNYFLKILTDFITPRTHRTGSERAFAQSMVRSYAKRSSTAKHVIQGARAASRPQKTTFEPCFAAILTILAYQKKQASESVGSSFAATAKSVYKNAELLTTSLGEPLKRQMHTVLLNVQKADTQHEIALLPLLFLNNLRTRPSSGLIAKAEAYGVANVFCWAAYTIYDDFLDEEGAPFRLPVANAAMRFSLRVYEENANRNATIKKVAALLYDHMDEANAWELLNCRYDKHGSKITIGEIPRFANYEVISNRASGHVIGIHMLAHQAGFGSRTMEHLRLGLHHFLVARQLSDDLHDWAQDFERGHITPVVSLLLTGAQIKPGVHSYPRLFARMQRYFWETGFVKISRLSESHIQKSKEAFLSINNIAKNGPFIDLIDSLKLSTDKSLEVYKEKKDFLREYKSKQFLPDS